MGNRALLTVIAVVLIGIFTIMLIRLHEKTPAEQINENINDVIASVNHKIDGQVR